MANKTVLVVEDNKLNMKLVRSLLHLGKYQILEAEDAENGIRLVRDHHPDLILMDIQLPGMDGLAATREIKNDPKSRDISVIALSYATEGDHKKARDAGCAGYIPKPIDTRRFLGTVSGFVNDDGLK